MKENPELKIDYLAMETSIPLLREHLNLLKEALVLEIEAGRILCVGIITDIFSTLATSLKRARHTLKEQSLIQDESAFLSEKSPLLITYLGNCLGNTYQDQEIELFSMIHNIFRNECIEILLGVSVKRTVPDEYKRNWDEFLLQTPRHLLENNAFLESVCDEEKGIKEFVLTAANDFRCPAVVPEQYTARYGIEGEIYRFYYKLSYPLRLSAALMMESKGLQSGTLILLYNIIKYDIHSLLSGIKKLHIFDIAYDGCHQIINTPNGEREYVVFSAYINK